MVSTTRSTRKTTPMWASSLGNVVTVDVTAFHSRLEELYAPSAQGVGNLTVTHCYKKARDLIKKRVLRCLAFNHWGRVDQLDDR